MPLTTRVFENDVTPEGAIPLKVRLLAMKARHLEDEFPNMPKPVRGRLGDMARPLLQIIRTIAPNHETDLMSLIRVIEKGRLQERSESLEAQIIRVMLDLEHKVDRGLIAVKLITDELNKGKPDNRQFTYQRIGKRINALGMSRGKTSNGAAGVIWDRNKLRESAMAYGVNLPSETSDSAGKVDAEHPDSDDSDHSDVAESFDLPF
jgi:hypothetical protein